MAVDKLDDGRLGKLDLSRKLGSSRPTLDKYLNMEGAPKPDDKGRFEVVAVLDWVRTHGNKALDSQGVMDWRAKKLELECERLMVDVEMRQHALSVEKGEHISKEEASNIIVPLMLELSSLLRQKFEVELPTQYRGKSAVESGEMNAKAIDEIVARIKSGTKKLRVEA